MSIQSPQLTPLKEQDYKKNMHEKGQESGYEISADSRRLREAEDLQSDSPSKRQKCLSPDLTVNEEDIATDNDDKENTQAHSSPSETIDMTNALEDIELNNNIPVEVKDAADEKIKEEQRLEKQRKRAAEKEQRERLKEEQRKEREHKKEEERLAKERKKEEDRIAKERKKEEEKLERERRKETERLERERKKELEKLDRERKKEEERLEREQKKEDERLERERKKEEERLDKERKKEEERLDRERKKEEERLDRERKKEEERIKKEEEKQRLEEEKARGQRKISSFFTVNSRRSPTKTEAVTDEVSKDISLYEQSFLPFFQKKTVSMAKSTQMSEADLSIAKDKFDKLLSTKSTDSKSYLMHSNKTEQQKVITSPDDIVNALNSPATTEDDVYRMLQNIPPIKYLHFYENSRPPFIGTWCSNEHTKMNFPILEPFNIAKTGFDYDYDSGLDWDGDEEGEGDDLDEEDMDEDEEMEDAEEDMNDFVDDDSKKRRKVVGVLVPVCQWNNGPDKTGEFNELKYEMLINVDLSIDPYCNYFDNSQAEKATEFIHEQGVQEVNNKSSGIPSNNATSKFLTGTKPTIKDEKILHQLIGFIEANVKFTIGTLTELAKSKEPFSQFTKSLLKHTIQDVATYNKSNSNWEVKTEIKDKLNTIYQS